MLQAAEPLQQDLMPLMAFTGTLGQRVYQSLRHAIMTLRFRPGEILRKPSICAALGVSRSPVSEALARLAVDGLVDVIPQAGTFVARFSMMEIREGAFLREAIEVAAIEQVACSITDDQLAALADNITAQAGAVAAADTGGFYALDGAMHEMLLSFTGFGKLAHVSQTAWLHVDRARQLILPVPGRVAATLREHRAIMAALQARNPDAARLAVRAHLRQLITYLAPLERDRPDLFAP